MLHHEEIMSSSSAVAARRHTCSCNSRCMRCSCILLHQLTSRAAMQASTIEASEEREELATQLDQRDAQLQQVQAQLAEVGAPSGCI